MNTFDYLVLLRGVWLGGLWTCLYLVRPVLEHQGYFPHHGMEIMHWLAGAGIAVGILMCSLALARHLFDLGSKGSVLLLMMLVLSGCYFGLMPWWKLQMILLHAQAVLGAIWIGIYPRQVV